MEDGNDSNLAPLLEEGSAPTATAGTGAADDHHPRPGADRQLSVFSPPRPRKGRIVLFEPPRQRQRWGERQVVPHVNWGDLYFDLFYVAAAYNLSYVLLYSMNTQGFLYLLGLMGPILFEWFTRTYFDARYSWGTDPWHGFVEIVRLCFLATSVVHIRPVYEMSQPHKYPDMFGFSLGMLMLSVCNVYVSAEVMFKVVGDAAAKRAERENIVSDSIQGVLYLLSAIFAGKSYYGNPDGHDTREGSYPPGFDSLFSACASLSAGMQGEVVEGEGAPSSSPASDDTSSPTNLPVYLCLGAWVFGVLFWALKWVLIPREKHKSCTVPLNVEYCIHRFGEIVMILLGESVLSLLITETSVNSGYYVTFYAGIVGCTLLQYLYFKYQPHSADEHALRKSWQAGVTFHVLMFVFLISLVALGASYKAFLIDHMHRGSSDNADYVDFLSGTGSGDNSKIMHNMEEHKYRAAAMYCISLGVILVTLDFMYATHKGPKKYWEFLKTKAGFAITMFRTSMCLFATTLALWIHSTETLALVGALTLAVEVIGTVIIEYFIHMDNPDEFDDVAGHWSDHFVVVNQAPEGAYA